MLTDVIIKLNGIGKFSVHRLSDLDYKSEVHTHHWGVLVFALLTRK